MNPRDTELSLCAEGCGFFATPENNNLCSKCYIDNIKENIDKHLVALRLEPEIEKSPAADCPSHPAVPAEETARKPEPTTKMRAKTQRCKMCNRKIGLLGFDCRCGNKFCSLHRYPEEHSCPSNYKESARLALAKQNPLISSDKLDRL